MLKKIKFSPKDNPDQSVIIEADSKEEAIKNFENLGLDLSNMNIVELTPCPYCHGLIGENKPLDISPNKKARLDMSSRGFYEYMTDGVGIHAGDKRFKYCPMCGRKLSHYD